MLPTTLSSGSRLVNLLAAALASATLFGCATGTEIERGGDDDADEDGAYQGGALRGAPTPHTGAAYPTGVEFGVNVGQFVAPGLHWQGYRDNTATEGEVAIEEYYDPDAFKGYDAVVLISSTVYCVNCQQEAERLNELISETGAWGQHGKIKLVTLMLEDDSHPGTIETAKKWKNEYGLTSAVVADPAYSVTGYGSFGTPLKILIDPRSMQIVARTEGWSPSDAYPELVSLLDKNASTH